MRDLSFILTVAMASTLSNAGCDSHRESSNASSGLSAALASAPVLDVGAKPSTGVRFGTAGCDQCLATQCNPYRGSIPLLAECADRACEQSFACFQQSHCATSMENVNECYCGKGVTNDQCLGDGFKARGACAPMVHRAMGSEDPRVVMGGLYSSTTSLGDGAALFQCASDTCAQECLLDPAIPPAKS